ncbi:MAG TPA: dienelactone hydrolase family protein [Candidatus Acidoferrales bacterium]|nr:dienelactone hydrolase family protein [Candidatus Acidoferrales bacterium]
MRSRQDLAGFAAAAKAAALSSMPSGAQTGLGAPHPAVVAENDASITVERSQIRRPDGMLDAYAAYPKTVRGNTPGIVLVMHEWGVDDVIRQTVRRFAKAGYMCIAPNLYSRMNAPSGDGTSEIDTFKPYAARLQRKQYGGDLRAAGLQLLAKAPNCKIGIAGLGLGGHLALIQALDNSDVFDAVALFYGAIKDIDPTEIHIPVCSSYGEKDPAIPAEEVRAWRTALRVPNDVRVYPSSGQAFFDATRNTYVASAADDAWRRVLGFFKDHLGLET